MLLCLELKSKILIEVNSKFENSKNSEDHFVLDTKSGHAFYCGAPILQFMVNRV